MQRQSSSRLGSSTGGSTPLLPVLPFPQKCSTFHCQRHLTVHEPYMAYGAGVPMHPPHWQPQCKSTHQSSVCMGTEQVQVCTMQQCLALYTVLDFRQEFALEDCHWFPPSRLHAKLLHACDQWQSSRVSTTSYCYPRKLNSVQTLKAAAIDNPVFAVDWLGAGFSSRPDWSAVFPNTNISSDGGSSNDSGCAVSPPPPPAGCGSVDEVEGFLVEGIEDLRIALGAEKLILLGHSLGGCVALASFCGRVHA
jgi:hypothetical protein